EKNLDGFLVSNFYNILYLSGFKTLTENEREGWMLITTRNTYLFSDSRYLNDKLQITNNNSIINNKYLIIKLITPEKGLIKHLKEIIVEEKIKKLGFEGEDLKYNEYLKFKERLGIELISTDKLLILQRAIKDEDEIKKIRKACQITDECLMEIVKTIKVGQTEKEIAFKIEFWLKEKSYDLAFYPIIAVDENSAIPHYDTRAGNNKKIKNRSIILVDFGAKYRDYMSDITRMIFIGKPDDEVVNIYNKLLYAQIKTIEQCSNLPAGRRGETICKNLDSFCRKKLNYPHSTGHGVGLEIHEYPKISSVSEDKLLPNQVTTIEPGFYFENKWGMRIEDTVLVKKDGVEVLTKFDKKPLII
ncbi:MAG: Xaa-Pro peptidase family protein, partial [Candidatus Roizmanbacteria bacterium]